MKILANRSPIRSAVLQQCDTRCPCKGLLSNVKRAIYAKADLPEGNPDRPRWWKRTFPICPACDATDLKPSFSRSGDSWLIADMYLDGVISELATRGS